VNNISATTAVKVVTTAVKVVKRKFMLRPSNSPFGIEQVDAPQSRTKTEPLGYLRLAAEGRKVDVIALVRGAWS
jgi:hypothetical protein